MIDDNELWSVEVNKQDILGSIERKVYETLAKYHLKGDELLGIALGPNEFNALRYQLSQFQRQPDISMISSRQISVFGRPVFCCAHIGITLLFDERWDVAIAEARKYLSTEGLDA